jgi:hypothetical protein
MYGGFLHALTAFSAEANGGVVNLAPLHALIVLMLSALRPGQPEISSAPLTALAALACATLFGLTLLASGWPVPLRRWRNAAVVESATHTPQARFGMFAWALTALLIVEPVDWEFYYVLALVGLAWLLSGPESDAQRSGRWPIALWRWLSVAALALTLAPLPLDSRTAPPMSLLYVMGIAARPLGLLGLWLAQAIVMTDGLRLRHAPLDALVSSADTN